MVTHTKFFKSYCRFIDAHKCANHLPLIVFFLLLLFSCKESILKEDSLKKEISNIANIDIEDFDLEQINHHIHLFSSKLDSISNLKDVEPLKATYSYKIGSLFMRRNSLDSAKIYFNQAHQFFRTNRNQYNPIRAKLYSDYGYTKFLSESDAQGASQFLNEAIAIVVADSVKNEISPYEKVIVLTNASEVSFVMNKFSEAIEFNHLALNYIPRIKQGPTRSHYNFRAYYELFNLQKKLVETNTDSLKKYLRRLKSYTPNERYQRFFHKLKGLYFMETNEVDSAIFYFTKAHEFDKKQMELKKGNANFADYYNFLEIQLDLTLALLNGGHYKKAKKELDIFENKFYNKIDSAKIDDDILELYHTASANYFEHFKDLKKYAYHHEQLKKIIDQDLEKSNHDSYNKISSLNLIHQKKSSISDLSENYKKEKKKLFYSRAILLFFGVAIILAGAFASSFYLQRKNAELLQEKERMSLKNKLLKTQLEPRFILNTLNNLNYLIDIDKKEDSITFLDNFGQLLRNTIQQTQDDLIPIEDEIQFLNSYCQLQKITHNNNFEYTIEVDEGLDIENLSISPFLIQPYIENAILDPSNNYEKDCTLNLSFKQGTEDVVVNIDVLNHNLSKDTEQDLTPFNAISKERFKLLSKQFGTKKEFTVSDKSKGIERSIIIHLPYKEM